MRVIEMSHDAVVSRLIEGLTGWIGFTGEDGCADLMVGAMMPVHQHGGKQVARTSCSLLVQHGLVETVACDLL